ncbi:DUF2090 domain-containing protein [candidate division WWE3 bacterium]|nr:DUF2090 domain-containing protein [candidate division WWE3 bacterium]
MHNKLEKFTTNGKILMLALDHRGSFMKSIDPANPDRVTKEKAIQVKSEIISGVYDLMSGTLIDKEIGLPAYKSLHDSLKPFLLPIEETGYTDEGGERVTKLKYTISELEEAGAEGVKLLIYCHPDAKTRNKQIETAGAVMEMAKEKDLPYFLELVTYNHKEDEFLILACVEQYIKAGVLPDVFKLEYPGSQEDSNQVTKLLNGIPWILLTKGDSFDNFANHLEIATSAGCVGFLAGRSLWQEGVPMADDNARRLFFNTTARDRFEKIVEIVSGS